MFDVLDNTPGEEGYWYHFSPQQTLRQLMRLIDLMPKDLQKGFQLPEGASLKVYKSYKDPSADPASAVLTYKGLKDIGGSPIQVEMLESEIHVVTRLDGREEVTRKDREIQTYVFKDMYQMLTN